MALYLEGEAWLTRLPDIGSEEDTEVGYNKGKRKATREGVWQPHPLPSVVQVGGGSAAPHALTLIRSTALPQVWRGSIAAHLRMMKGQELSDSDTPLGKGSDLASALLAGPLATCSGDPLLCDNEGFGKLGPTHCAPQGSNLLQLAGMSYTAQSSDAEAIAVRKTGNRLLREWCSHWNAKLRLDRIAGISHPSVDNMLASLLRNGYRTDSFHSMWLKGLEDVPKTSISIALAKAMYHTPDFDFAAELRSCADDFIATGSHARSTAFFERCRQSCLRRASQVLDTSEEAVADLMVNPGLLRLQTRRRGKKEQKVRSDGLQLWVDDVTDYEEITPSGFYLRYARSRKVSPMAAFLNMQMSATAEAYTTLSHQCSSLANGHPVDAGFQLSRVPQRVWYCSDKKTFDDTIRPGLLALVYSALLDNGMSAAPDVTALFAGLGTSMLYVCETPSGTGLIHYARTPSVMSGMLTTTASDSYVSVLMDLTVAHLCDVDVRTTSHYAQANLSGAAVTSAPLPYVTTIKGDDAATVASDLPDVVAATKRADYAFGTETEAEVGSVFLRYFYFDEVVLAAEMQSPEMLEAGLYAGVPADRLHLQTLTYTGLYSSRLSKVVFPERSQTKVGITAALREMRIGTWRHPMFTHIRNVTDSYSQTLWGLPLMQALASSQYADALAREAEANILPQDVVEMLAWRSAQDVAALYPYLEVDAYLATADEALSQSILLAAQLRTMKDLTYLVNQQIIKHD